MPKPLVKRGTWEKERSRNKNGRWRKKRSDTGKRRKYKRSLEEEEGREEKVSVDQPLSKEEKDMKHPKKILVECEVNACIHNEEGHCKIDPLHLIVSYGRSTDYVHEFMCEDMEPRNAVIDS